MTERIMSLASGLVNPSETEVAVLEALCCAAETKWMNSLRSGVTPESCGEAFLCAAAFSAAADFVVGRSSEGIESFTAGEISIKRGGSAGMSQAEALRKAAERLMAPYSTAESFAFKGVRG